MEKYKFCKLCGKEVLNILHKDFNVDIEHLNISENYIDKKYIKSEMANDLLLFFSDDMLLGALKDSKRIERQRTLMGRKWTEYYYQFEDKSYGIFDSYGKKVPRNRKHYLEHSTYVVRIKQQDMRRPLVSKPVENKPLPLSKRLDAYKISKVENITDEQIKGMINEVVNTISKNLFQPLPNDFMKIKCNYIHSYPEAMSEFMNIVRRYEQNKKDSELHKQMNIGYDLFFNEKRMNENKIEIIEWSKTFK